MSRTLRAPGRGDGAHRARRRAQHRARSYRGAVAAVLSVVALIALTVTVALSVVRPGPAAGNPTAAARHARAAGARLPMAAADRRECIGLVIAGLRSDLLAMDAGRPVTGTSTDQLIASRWPADSPERARVKAAFDALLLTAASDLFGQYARNVSAEVAGYGPRIAAACG